MRRVHFVAIGGTGMGSLAGLVKARGIEVTGSDKALYPPMSTALQDWGIEVELGFDPSHLGTPEPDLVVIGNAVGPQNPEARAAIDGGLDYRSFSDALYELAIADKHSIVISGTHGKTTTTNLAAFCLDAVGRDPSFLVGGISLDFGGSFREGSGRDFVVEGDEYDTAFFDKTPKFLHYHAQTLVMTSVEFDHADIYRDLDHVKEAFRQVVAEMPSDGTIIAAGNCAGVRDVVSEAPCRVLFYGVERDGADALDWRASKVESDASGTVFELCGPDFEAETFRVPMHGEFNVENAVAALATLSAVGVDPGLVVDPLARIQGVKRRQELRGEVRGIAVIDDFAHHPTAVEGSIAALRSRYAGRRLVAVFEPRTNTSRRSIFQSDYARALSAADRVIIKRVPDEPIYSATGEVTERFSADDLVRDLRARDVRAEAFDEVAGIVDHLRAELRPGDVVLVMSNGGFDDIWDRLLDALKG